METDNQVQIKTFKKSFRNGSGVKEKRMLLFPDVEVISVQPGGSLYGHGGIPDFCLRGIFNS